VPGTVDDTADEVTRRGGRGIAVPCDHTVEDQVRALAERVRAETGRLDLLVNNAWGGYESKFGGPGFLNFWQQGSQYWEAMMERGVRTTMITTHHLLPLMLPSEALAAPAPIGLCQKCFQFVRPGEAVTPGDKNGLFRHDHDCVAALTQVPPRGLIVSTIAWTFGKPMSGYYGVSKAAVVRFMEELAHELRPWGIAACAVAPGFMRTERVMQVLGESSPVLDETESPEYVGRGIAALAADPERMERSGQVLAAGDLARVYGFTDVDGRQPPRFEI